MKKKMIAAIALFTCIMAGALTFLQSADGELVGTVGEVNKATGEVVVQAQDAAAKMSMGNLVYVRIDGKAVIMRVTFPMMSLAKCRLEPGSAKDLGRITKGMVVRRYMKDVDEAETKGTKPVEIAGKAFDIKIVGGIEMVRLPAGKVPSFLIGKYEVTQRQYEEIMGTNPSYFKGKPNNPVENVSWYGAVEFCNKLSEKANLKSFYIIIKDRKDPENFNEHDNIKWTVTINKGAIGFRLPTSEEWEYGCRAGTTSKQYWGKSKEFSMVDQYEVYDENSNNKGIGHPDYGTHPVGTKKPNPWGLYDMGGNVSEWCYDWHPSSVGIVRVKRCGSWNNRVRSLESGFEDDGSPYDQNYCTGFRLVCTE